MDWLLKPFGLTQDQQAELYSTQLKDDRSGTKEWNAGDMLRDVFTPGTREELEEKARKFKEDKINKLSSATRGTITESLAGTGINATGLKIGTNETQEEYDARLTGLQTRGAANIQNLAIPGYDPSKVTAGMGASEIVRLGTTQKTTNAETEEEKRKKEIRRQEGIVAQREQDGRTERANIRSSDLEIQRNNNNLTRELSRADNKLTRDLGILSSDNQMQIAQMNADLQDKRMEYDRETRRLDKRSAAIAQLMAGIGSLGGAFAL